jgi:hypothetical protein
LHAPRLRGLDPRYRHGVHELTGYGSRRDRGQPERIAGGSLAASAYEIVRRES